MQPKPLLCVCGIILLSTLNLLKLAQPIQSQPPPCEPPEGNGPNAVWRAGVRVNLYIDPNFGTNGQDTIATQISTWNTATGLNVDFQVKTTTEEMGPGATSGGEITWFVWRRVPPNLGSVVQGETGGIAIGGKRADSSTSINPGVTSALGEVASHEVGHTFGLKDCPTCSSNSSAMTLPINFNLNALEGHIGPTQCDVCAVAKNILSLPTSTCTPSPTPTPTPQPPNEEDCLTAGGFWNFQNSACYSEPQNCYGHCVPYFPLESGGCEASIDYCGFQWGCPFGLTDGGQGCCCGPTPIVIDLAGNGFNLTSARNGVHFDMGGDGHSEPIAWTSAGSDDAWLVLDRDQNGRIDNAKEMFGNFTDQPHTVTVRNGFEALAEFDRLNQDGNRDGMITRKDSVFKRLQLWVDTNHNAISEASELFTLASKGIASLDLDYKPSKRRDAHGNHFALRAKVKDIHGAQVGRWAWDVTLDVNPPPLR
jgi:hypothetical protein